MATPDFLKLSFWKIRNLENRKFENSKIGKSRNREIWKSGKSEIGKFGNQELWILPILNLFTSKTTIDTETGILQKKTTNPKLVKKRTCRKPEMYTFSKNNVVWGNYGFIKTSVFALGVWRAMFTTPTNSQTHTVRPKSLQSQPFWFLQQPFVCKLNCLGNSKTRDPNRPGSVRSSLP